MRRREFLWTSTVTTLGLATGGLLAGCGSRGSVTLTASLQAIQLSVAKKTLGTVLSGSFEVFLEVGPEATDSSTVTLQSFSIVTAKEGTQLVPTLAAKPDGATFPLRVEVGQTREVKLVLDESKLLEASVADALCADSLKLVGAITDTLNSGKTTQLDEPFKLGGC